MARTAANIEKLKIDVASLRDALKQQKAEVKIVDKEISKLEAKKAKADASAAEEAKKAEAESVFKD